MTNEQLAAREWARQMGVRQIPGHTSALDALATVGLVQAMAEAQL